MALIHADGIEWRGQLTANRRERSKHSTSDDFENGLERPCGRSRPAPRHLASLVAADAFAG